MAYIKNNWVDQSVERPKTYEMTNNSDGSVTLIDSFGLVSELGTPVNADNMNHIEEGIEACDLRKYDTSETYNKGEWVTGIVDQEKSIYSSLVDNNLGNLLTDTTKWEKVELGGGSGTSLPLFAPVILDRILSFEESKGYALQGTYVYKTGVAGERYGYPTFVQRCFDEKNAGEATQVTLGSSTITMYTNPNGHQFYDIADKTVVDAWFDTYGIADFYGVDETNERVFLPRNKWFMQLTTDTSDVNKFNEAGLPSIDHTHTLSVYTVNTTGGVYTGAGNSPGPLSYSTPTLTTSAASGLNSIYGRSNTVQPASSNKLLYYVVGNTEVVSAVTDAADITTSENDTIPLGFSTYQGGNVQPSVAWLMSEGQWNSGALYTTFYNHYVLLIGQAFAAGYVRNHTDDYDDYDLVINQEDMTFRLPLLDGSEDLPTTPIAQSLPTTSGQKFTAKYNGVIYIGATSSGATQYVQLHNLNTAEVAEMRTPLANVFNGTSLWANKGDTYMITGDVISTIKYHTLIKAAGNGSLYFKVGNAVQNQELIDVAELTNEINNLKSKPHITETYVNGTSGYRIWSDGFCEQWGLLQPTGNANTWFAITLLKKYSDTNYYASLCNSGTSTGTVAVKAGNEVQNTTTTLYFCCSAGDTGVRWNTAGYLAEGEY